MPIKAIIFDLDGTLLDTLEDIADAVNGVLSERGFPSHRIDAYRYFVGDGSETLVRRALPAEKRSDQNVRSALAAFKEAYGFVAGDDVLRFTAIALNELVDTYGTPDDFIGHAGNDNFIIITTDEAAQKILAQVKERFTAEILSHYNFIDRDQGYILTTDQGGNSIKVPLMTISIGIVSPSQYQFSDIREITELAAQARRQGR